LPKVSLKFLQILPKFRLNLPNSDQILLQKFLEEAASSSAFPSPTTLNSGISTKGKTAAAITVCCSTTNVYS